MIQIASNELKITAQHIHPLALAQPLLHHDVKEVLDVYVMETTMQS